MRDFHDAKAMAQTLRDVMAEKHISLSHSESLELVAKTLGVSDWNTLSAVIQNNKRKDPIPFTKGGDSKQILPAIPVRDFVPFPTSTFPLFVGREETKRALSHAFAHHREVALLLQKDPLIDDPNAADVYDIGVLATLLDIEHLQDGPKFDGKEPPPAGGMKILVHAQKRVTVQKFFKEAGAYYAEVIELAALAAPEDRETIENIVELFESYVRIHKINVPATWPILASSRDTSRVADFMSQHIVLPLGEKHQLLATNDPVARIEKIRAILKRGEAA